MIRKDHLEFLKEVRNNNNREWFEGQKKRYKALQTDLYESVQNIASKLQRFDDNLNINPSNIDQKTKVFRIYRDMRFSKDKTPYKISLAGEIFEGKMKEGFPVYYVHIQPGASFVAGGIHMPDSKLLKDLRAKIDTKYGVLDGILEEKEFKKVFPNGLNKERALKTSPRDYSAEHPGIDFLRLKGFTVSKALTDNEVLSKDFEDKVLDICKQISNLNGFLYLG
jgi:uncharacterized protein (TIGR02453 family)